MPGEIIRKMRVEGTNYDLIMVYSKSADAIWNPQFEPLSAEYVKSHYSHDDPDGRRYRWDNATAAGAGPARTFFGKVLEPPSGTHWRWSQDRINELSKKGLIGLTSNGRPQFKRYLDENPGKAIQAIWTDISPVKSQSNEDTRFDTQKPAPLLERIIRASSNQDSLVADFFCSNSQPATRLKNPPNVQFRSIPPKTLIIPSEMPLSTLAHPLATRNQQLA